MCITDNFQVVAINIAPENAAVQTAPALTSTSAPAQPAASARANAGIIEIASGSASAVESAVANAAPDLPGTVSSDHTESAAFSVATPLNASESAATVAPAQSATIAPVETTTATTAESTTEVASDGKTTETKTAPANQGGRNEFNSRPLEQKEINAGWRRLAGSAMHIKKSDLEPRFREALKAFAEVKNADADALFKRLNELEYTFPAAEPTGKHSRFLCV